jgi:Putative beta-lactamase-inhibitor-like, PepSY-like
MRMLTLGIVAALVLGISGRFDSTRADEEKVALDKVPQAIKDGVKKRFPNSEIKGASKETEGGKTSYEITIKNEGRAIDVTLTPEGVISGIEKEVDVKDLPKIVAASVVRKYPNATYKLIEEVIKVADGKENLEYYEILLVTVGKKKLEVVVTPAGKLTREEDKGSE